MATLSILDSGSSATNGASTASCDWGTDTAGLLFCVGAYASSSPTSVSVSGGGATWVTLAGPASYATRRAVFLLQSQDGAGNHQTPTDGALTITYSGGGGAFREHMWFVCEFAAWDGTTVDRNGSWADGGSGTTLTSGAIGTITGTDLAVMMGCFETSGVTTGADTGSTEQDTLGAGSDVRHANLVTSTTDSTPGVTSSSSTNMGGAAIIVRGGSTGSHSSGPAASTFAGLTLLGVGN